MSDGLVKRLREVSGMHFNDRVALWHHTINAAADALARLRSENEALKGECERLREAIKAHNAGCESACEWRREHGSCAYRNPDGSHRYGNKNCSDCPVDSTIDIKGAAK